MSKTFDVNSDGRIKGLQVIGFHGEVDLAQTPARREPIFADAEGHLVGLEGGTFNTKTVRGRVGPHVDSNPSPGIFTRLARSCEASWASLVVVLGETELGLVQELMAARREGAQDPATAFLSWLSSGTPTSDSVTAQRLDSGAVWYCGIPEAAALYRVISKVAEQHMLHASNQGEDRRLYQASWWLARAAMDDSDRYFAAVGLELSDRRMADAYLKATFRKRPSDELEAGLKHARGVFEERRADLARKRWLVQMPGGRDNAPVPAPTGMSAGLSPVPFGQYRSKVRGRFVVPAPGKAA